MSDRKMNPMKFGPSNASEARVFAEEEFRIDVQHAIHKLMLTKHVSQGKLAARLGVSEARISQVFSDRCNITVRMLARIYHALGERCQLVPAAAVEAARAEVPRELQILVRGCVSAGVMGATIHNVLTPAQRKACGLEEEP